MVEVSDEVGSLGEESNEEEGGEGGEEGKRVPRTRMESIRGGTSVCLTGPTCVFRCPGRPNTRVSTRRGWIKAAASYLPSSSPYGSNPRGRTRVCARVLPAYIYIYARNSMVSNVIGISFLLASEEQAVCSNIARNYCRRPFPDPEKGRNS